jgi:hypothetical protein
MAESQKTERTRQQLRTKKREQYTLEEDTSIVARTIINVVLSTRQDVDPHAFVVALLEEAGP